MALPVMCLPLLLIPHATPVLATPQLGPSLGDAHAQVRLDARGHVHRAVGALGTLGAGEAGARARVDAIASSLGLEPQEAATLRLLEDVLDARGNRHVRFARSIFGIPVEFDELRLHARPTGTIHAIEADLSSFSGVSRVAPRFPPARAVKLARDGYDGPLDQPTNATLTWLGQSAGLKQPRLAYRVRISHPRRHALPFVHDVYVDAKSGALLLKLNQVQTAGNPATMNSVDLWGNNASLNVSVFSDGVLMQDLVSLSGGRIMTVDASNGGNAFLTASTNNPFGDATGVTIHDAVRRVHDNFASSYGWNNWDFATRPAGANGELYAFAHEGTNLPNAFFTTGTNNGRAVGIMKFGDGDGQTLTQTPRCFDVTGHELGHGVVAGTAGLVYQFQSGALNEHMADVFGWLMDQGNDTIGENCVGPQLAPALRDMCNPGSVPQAQPSNMSEYRDLPNTEQGDNGGVHVNSGIPNRAACLARNATNADTVGKVWFQALRHHLGPQSTFQDMVGATATGCGETNVGSSACAAIANAWVSVGLGQASNNGQCPANATLQDGSCFCNAGFQPNSAGNGCDAVSTANCPPNSNNRDGTCYCDDGFVPNADGTACVSANTACPSHSHRENGTCVCDACYQGNPNGNGQGCDPEPNCAVCTNPLQDSVNGSCQCIAGITPLCGPQSAGYTGMVNGQAASGRFCCQEGDPCGWAGNGTCDCASECNFDSADCGSANSAPVCGASTVGDCGRETWAGRCVANLLVYCNDQDPAAKYVNYIQCDGQAGTVCGSDSNGGFDCVQQQDNCQGVPASGQCSGSTARYCDNGVLKSVECGASGCREFSYQGTTLNYCYPCGPNSTLNDAQDACNCNAGYAPNAAGDACVGDGTAGTCDGGVGDDGKCIEQASCACAAVPGEAPWMVVAFVGLALLRARRRP